MSLGSHYRAMSWSGFLMRCGRVPSAGSGGQMHFWLTTCMEEWRIVDLWIGRASSCEAGCKCHSGSRTHSCHCALRESTWKTAKGKDLDWSLLTGSWARDLVVRIRLLQKCACFCIFGHRDFEHLWQCPVKPMSPPWVPFFLAGVRKIRVLLEMTFLRKNAHTNAMFRYLEVAFLHRIAEHIRQN